MILKKAETIAYMLMGLLVLVGAVLGYLIFYQENKTNITNEETPVSVEETIEPQEYIDERYGFKVTLPDGWEVTEHDLGGSPLINFYPTTYPLRPDTGYNHTTNAVHVSVYPLGIPVAGLFTQTRPLDIIFDDNVSEESYAFMLNNGDIFARRIVFKEQPSSWNESGFLWTRVFVEDQRGGCLTPGGEFGEFCDPNGADEVVIIGEVDITYDEDIRNIVESFEFVE